MAAPQLMRAGPSQRGSVGGAGGVSAGRTSSFDTAACTLRRRFAPMPLARIRVISSHSDASSQRILSGPELSRHRVSAARKLTDKKIASHNP